MTDNRQIARNQFSENLSYNKKYLMLEPVRKVMLGKVSQADSALRLGHRLLSLTKRAPTIFPLNCHTRSNVQSTMQKVLRAA